MMSLNSLMIPCVESRFTAEYIANAFWNQHIAQVKTITLIPYLKNTVMFQLAYIVIENWCDSEAAYNFIKRLQKAEGEVRMIHQTDEWWPIQLSSYNYNTDKNTVCFPSSFFFPRDSADWTDVDAEILMKWSEDLFFDNIHNIHNVTLRPHQKRFMA
jgi:hypothetical protein